MTGVSYIEKRNLPGLGCIFLLTSTFNLTIAIIHRNVSLRLSVFRYIHRCRVWQPYLVRSFILLEKIKTGGQEFGV